MYSKLANRPDNFEQREAHPPPPFFWAHWVPYRVVSFIEILQMARNNGGPFFCMRLGIRSSTFGIR